jgi:hypothetical protein
MKYKTKYKETPENLEKTVVSSMRINESGNNGLKVGIQVFLLPFWAIAWSVFYS